jgi:DNA repair protein RecN (Recombination protein N)
MLQRIRIEDYALIQDLEIELDEGLNVITGETGAGKSIIIDAITLLLGQRGNKENIRLGADKMLVQAFFDVSDNGVVSAHLKEMDIPVENGELLLSRSIDTKGRNVCRANGMLITVGQLKTLGETLVDIHSQHEHNRLFLAESHKRLLDAYGGEESRGLLAQTAEKAGQLKELRTKILATERDNRETGRLKETLEFELADIQKARLTSGEDAVLERDKKILENSEKLYDNASDAYHLLNGNEDADQLAILPGLAELTEAVGRLAAIDDAFARYTDALQSAYTDLETIAGELYTYLEGIEFDVGVLDEVEKRISQLAGLKRKYGGSVDDIIAYGDKLAAQLSQLTNRDAYRDQLKKEYMAVWREYKQISGRLYALRQRSAVKLKAEMERELHQLAMEKAEIAIVIDQDDQLISPTGQNHVEFLISANPSIPPRPIRKIASGGEISRIMLALKCIFGGLDEIDTMIFDEIDTGISGRTAQSVAEKIVRLSRKRQLICITHLPQIAAMADKHYRVEKTISGDRVDIHFRALDLPERREELARMLSGAKVTATALEHAGEMIESAETFKIPEK